MVSCIIYPFPTNSNFLKIFSLIFIMTFVINHREPLLPETLIICLVIFLSFNFSEMVELQSSILHSTRLQCSRCFLYVNIHLTYTISRVCFMFDDLCFLTHRIYDNLCALLKLSIFTSLLVHILLNLVFKQTFSINDE